VKRTNPFPHCYPDKDRQGRPRWLLRLPGHKAMTIKGTYGAPEFAAAYRAALESCEAAPKAGLGRTTPGTFAALAMSYLTSATFKNGKRPETQRSERGIINGLIPTYGKCPVGGLRKELVQQMVDKKADKPSAARNRLNVLRVLMDHAIAIGWREDNPTIGVKRPKIDTPGFAPWKEAHIATYRSHWLHGTRERLAIELVLNGGPRPRRRGQAWAARRGRRRA
jgi:hypothetical protein